MSLWVRGSVGTCVRGCVGPWVVATAALLAVTPLVVRPAYGQHDPSAVTGAYYRIRPPLSSGTSFNSIEVERIAPGALAPPPPIGPIDIGASLQFLTGQLLELPSRHRIYFTGIDVRGVVRLLELDFFNREIRHVVPPAGRPVPTALALAAPRDANKLYVQWGGPGSVLETDVYDSETLAWLGNVVSFRPDERAWGFEHKAPYMWTIGRGDQLVLVDTQIDDAVVGIAPERFLGPAPAAAVDAWRDLVLFRIAADGVRYQLVDVGSGEVGAPVDAEELGRGVARLGQNGRVMILLKAERGPLSRYTRRRVAAATGPGVVYELASGERVADFVLAIPPDVPTYAVGTDDDPSVPGRLWVHALGDRERFDFGWPDCRKPPEGDRIDARLEVTWDPSRERRRYSYAVVVAGESEGAVSAVAIEAGRAVDDATRPYGWGIDQLKSERWVRWMNGLGPAREDVAAGEALGGFDVISGEEARPGIGEYRIQGALGLPRGCESDDRFLKNSLKGYTIVPELVTDRSTKDRARRLEKLVEDTCDIEWLDEATCRTLRRAADEVEKRRDEGSLDAFDEALARATAARDVKLMLRDASDSVRQTFSQ